MVIFANGLFAAGLSGVIKISVYILFCLGWNKEFVLYIELKDDINDDDNRKDGLFVDDYDVIIYLLN